MSSNKLLLGWAFLAATAIAWIAASFLAQFLVSGPQPQLHPFLLCWLCTSMFSLYLPIVRLQHWARARSKSGNAHATAQQQQPLLPAEEGPDDTGCDSPPLLFPGLSRPAAVLKVLPVAVVFTLAQTLFTVSLANTSVSSNTILSSSSSMWTLLASALVLRERITAVKLASVVAVMAGTALVTLADAEASAASDHSLYGDALCVAAAVCYSCYTVIMRRQLREDDPLAPALLFGHVGVLVAVLGAPLVLLLHVLGEYNLQALDPTAVGLALLNGLLDYVVADYTWARGVLLLGPTVATLGMSVQVPIGTAADAVLGHPHWLDSWQAVGLTASGTLLILGGVAGINLGPHTERRQAGVAGVDEEEAAVVVADNAAEPPPPQDATA